MSVASQRLKGRRSFRHLDDHFDAEGNVVEKGARSVAKELMEEYGVPVFIGRQKTKDITTKDGRSRHTFDGYYNAFSETDLTIESVKPEGWVDEKVESVGKLAREERQAMAEVAKVALADAMEQYLTEDDDDANERARTTFAVWARRIPGDAWDERLGEQ